MFVWVLFTVLYLLSGEQTLVSGNISCDPNDMHGVCPENQTCMVSKDGNAFCVCLPEYTMIQDKCVPSDTTSASPVTASARVVTDVPQTQHKTSNSAVVSGVLAAIVFAALAGALVYVAHRYRWLQWIRQRRQRQYDEMHIGREDDDDDPPIA